MKRFWLTLAFFAVCGCASMRITAQEPAVTAQEPEFPDCKLDMKKMIGIVADYDIIHQNEIAAGEDWGLTSLANRKMYLSDAPDEAIRKMTVIHEMLHVCYGMKGVDTHDGLGEETVRQKAIQLYRELWGND